MPSKRASDCRMPAEEGAAFGPERLGAAILQARRWASMRGWDLRNRFVGRLSRCRDRPRSRHAPAVKTVAGDIPVQAQAAGRPSSRGWVTGERMAGGAGVKPAWSDRLDRGRPLAGPRLATGRRVGLATPKASASPGRCARAGAIPASFGSPIVHDGHPDRPVRGATASTPEAPWGATGPPRQFRARRFGAPTGKLPDAGVRRQSRPQGRRRRQSAMAGGRRQAGVVESGWRSGRSGRWRPGAEVSPAPPCGRAGRRHRRRRDLRICRALAGVADADESAFSRGHGRTASLAARRSCGCAGSSPTL